mmetsp:Transcript_76557/g.212646  ORF Transcript_76557/g.212646 Transcript_76557/m.212646 type:complete len:259 (+) Transcript_76557:1040-1816(+)
MQVSRDRPKIPVTFHQPLPSPESGEAASLASARPNSPRSIRASWSNRSSNCSMFLWTHSRVYVVSPLPSGGSACEAPHRNASFRHARASVCRLSRRSTFAFSIHARASVGSPAIAESKSSTASTYLASAWEPRTSPRIMRSSHSRDVVVRGNRTDTAGDGAEGNAGQSSSKLMASDNSPSAFANCVASRPQRPDSVARTASDLSCARRRITPGMSGCLPPAAPANKRRLSSNSQSSEKTCRPLRLRSESRRRPPPSLP